MHAAGQYVIMIDGHAIIVTQRTHDWHARLDTGEWECGRSAGEAVGKALMTRYRLTPIPPLQTQGMEGVATGGSGRIVAPNAGDRTAE